MPEYTVFAVYAVLTGALVGLAAVFFHETIAFFENLFFKIGLDKLSFIGGTAIILMPAIGMLIQSLMTSAAPETAKKRGVSEVIKAVAVRGGFIKLRTTLFHFLAPAINIGSGGTVGPEGPAAQIGGGVASKLGQVLGLSDSRRRMFTAAGSGAAIAAVFNTPLGGVFFALEIILLNDFQSATFSALILASVSASAISRIFLGNSPAFQFTTVSIGEYEQMYLYVILGIFAGVLSILYIRYSSLIRKLFSGYILQKLPKWLVMVLVGLTVGTAGYFFKGILGIGYETVNSILADSAAWNIVMILLVLKFLLVPMILNSGGFGGIFAPSLFMGACFGYLFALTLNNLWGLNLDTTAFVLVSMGAVLGGINSIPISSILIIFEMTKDYSFILPLMLAVVISTTIVQLVLKGSVHVQQLEAQGFNIKQGRETSILKSLLVKDILRNDAEFIKENTPLPVVVSSILESQHGTFFTINENKEITGFISANELRPIITEYEQLRDMLVASDVSNHDVIRVYENDNLDDVLKLFGDKNQEQFPVVDKFNPDKIIGTVWRQDVIDKYNKESLKYNLADGLARELKTIEKTQTSKVAEGYSIIEKKAPEKFIGKSIKDLRIRNIYGLEILMIKQTLPPVLAYEKEDEIVIPSPDYKIQLNDTLVLFGADEKIIEAKKW
jgi:CIC family chloride channel protein